MRRIVLRGSLLLAACALALGGLRWLDLNPITLAGFPREIELEGTAPGPGRRGDVVVWIDSPAIVESSRARSFARLDLSCAWISLLEGRLGAVGVRDGAAATPGRPRALVVTSSAAKRVGPESVESLLAEGATVLVDAAESGIAAAPWLERVRVATAGLIAPHAPDLAPLVAAAAGAEFAALPFVAPPAWARYAPLDSDSTPLPAAEFPLAYERLIGKGRLIVAAVPLARWWTRLALGQPEDDFSIVPRFGDYDDICEPDDLALDAAQRTCEVPFSDRLAEALVALLDPPAAPLPRVAWYPRGATGVYLMTHDEDLRGGAEMASLAALDSAAKIRGTHFVIGHPRLLEDWHDGHVAAILGAGGALAVHWNRFPTPHGAWKVEPVQWVASLEEQAAWLAGLPLDRPRWNRNHFLIVDGTWSSGFRAMEASGIAFDSTYAANKGRGYLFGSAMPRRIVDENGLLLNVREVAFHNQEDWGDADPAFFTRLFAANAESNRGAIVSIFHPPRVLRAPTPRATIEHAVSAALATGHRSFTAPEYGRFVESNLALELDSRELDGGALAVSYGNAGDGQAVLIPRRSTGSRVEPSGFESATESIGGIPYLRVELRPGAGGFTVVPD